MKLVLDTHVLVSGLLWDGPPARVLDRVDAGLDRLFISRTLLMELADVLSRPKFIKVFQQFHEDPRDLIAAIAARAIVLEPKPLSSPVILADPADDHVLACALTAEVDVIISGDEHLLGLSKIGAIPILTPAAYVRKQGRPL
jgi:putative PIN family toxin of toxin-antitoxin system